MAHTLYIITGKPGSGKTHYGKQLAEKLRAPFIDIDTSTETLVQAAQKALGESIDDRDSPLFKSRFRDAIYETQFAIASDNLSHTDVVLTGPFTTEIKDAKWPTKLESKIGSPVKVIYTWCSPEIMRKRIKMRNNPRDAAKLSNWGNYMKYYGIDVAPICPHDFVNTE